MSAFLTADVLRAHAAPLNLRDTVPRTDAPPPVRRTDAPRPVLTARWVVQPDGHLACRWQADDPTPDRPPL